MKIVKDNIFFFYLISYSTLIIGLLLNEDFALGYIRDYELHKISTDIFDYGLLNGLINYEEKKIPHSPIYLYYFSLTQKLFNNELIAKLINIHICLLIPFFTYKSLLIKTGKNFNLYISLLPAVFFVSPYFRSGSIWIDDNLLALVFFSISIYYFVLFKYTKDSLVNLFLNVLFFSFAAYVRPIFCLFAIYFFFQYFFILKVKNKIYYYCLFNIVLSFPAIYYVIILGINDWFQDYLFRVNLITVFSLSISVITFYLLPYIFYFGGKKSIFLLTLKEFAFLIIFFISLFFYFDYDLNYSGGIFYKLSNLIFNNNLLYFFITSIVILYLFKLLLKNRRFIYKLSDFIVIFILILFELDGVIYHETYDPLIYILIFFIFDNNFVKKFIKNLNLSKFLIIYMFSIMFYFLSVIKTFIY